MQTMNTIREGKTPQKAVDTAKTAKKNTDFGDMLSDVVNDSTLTKPAPQDKPITTETNNTITAPTPNTIPVASDIRNTSVPPETNNAVTKVLQESTDTGTHAVFVDVNNPNDTVNVFIPSENTPLSSSSAASNSQTVMNTAPPPTPQNNTFLSTPTDTTATTGTKTVGNPFYSSTDSNVNSSKNISTSTLTNANCKEMATDDDVAKLKKKIIGEKDPDIMIVVAKKILKAKCVTTDQVKTIGALFLNDEARYNFYEALYSSTYDHGNYPSLQSQLLDPYYKKRFQTMLR